jgi:hypothetical protein
MLTKCDIRRDTIRCKEGMWKLIVWRELQFRTLLLHDKRFTVLEGNCVLVITGHAAKIYWDVKAQIDTRREWLASLPGHISFGTHRLGGCVSPQRGYGRDKAGRGKKKNCSARNRTPITYWPRPIQYTNRDISVLSECYSVRECA